MAFWHLNWNGNALLLFLNPSGMKTTKLRSSRAQIWNVFFYYVLLWIRTVSGCCCCCCCCRRRSVKIGIILITAMLDVDGVIFLIIQSSESIQSIQISIRPQMFKLKEEQEPNKENWQTLFFVVEILWNSERNDFEFIVTRRGVRGGGRRWMSKWRRFTSSRVWRRFSRTVDPSCSFPCRMGHTCKWVERSVNNQCRLMKVTQTVIKLGLVISVVGVPTSQAKGEAKSRTMRISANPPL